MTIETMSATAILAVRRDEPERLFGGDPNKIGEIFRALAKRWHPDHNPTKEAGSVIAHLTALRAAAEERVSRGDWRKPGIVEFQAVDGRRFELKSLRSHDFELGEIHISSQCIAYAIRKEHADLVAAGKSVMARLTFRGEDMRQIFEGRLPRVLAEFETADRFVVVLKKTADQILLRDLLAHCGGRLDPRHVAWIVSELESLACYLGLPFIGIANPGLGPDSILVSPQHHAVSIVGGWPYGVALGEKLKAAPGRVVDHAPKSLLSADHASERLTLEALRLMACECLGHSNPVTLQRDAGVPEPLARWLLHPSAETAVKDYESWSKARDASFGPRKFVELAVDPSAVYAAK
jgi:hypothetical protein